MSTTFRSLLCAVLLSMSGPLFASSTATPFIKAEQANIFAELTPNQLAKVQSTSNVEIGVPFNGYHNNWRITFTDDNGAYYQFTTSSSITPGYYYPLGSIPAGIYDVSFEKLDSREAMIDYSFGCETRWWYTPTGNSDLTIQDREFTEECNLININAN